MFYRRRQEIPSETTQVFDRETEKETQEADQSPMEHFTGCEIKKTETADSRVDILFPHSEDENNSGEDRFQTTEADSSSNLETVESRSDMNPCGNLALRTVMPEEPLGVGKAISMSVIPRQSTLQSLISG